MSSKYPSVALQPVFCRQKITFTTYTKKGINVFSNEFCQILHIEISRHCNIGKLNLNGKNLPTRAQNIVIDIVLQ